MALTKINPQDQIPTASLTRAMMNTATTGSAVITKVIAGTNITISDTGVDAGTGDVTINAAGGGSTVTNGQTTITFGSSGNPAFETTTAVTGQSSILTTSYVDARILVAASTGSPGHMADEHSYEPIIVTAGNIVAGTGFTIYASSPIPLIGTYNVQWVWR